MGVGCDLFELLEGIAMAGGRAVLERTAKAGQTPSSHAG